MADGDGDDDLDLPEINVEAPTGVEGAGSAEGPGADSDLFGDDPDSAASHFDLDPAAGAGGLGAETSSSLTNLNATFNLMRDMGIINTRQNGGPVAMNDFLAQVHALQSYINQMGPGFLPASPLNNALLQQLNTIAPATQKGDKLEVLGVAPRYEELLNLPASHTATGWPPGGTNTLGPPSIDYTLGYDPAQGFIPAGTTTTIENPGTTTTVGNPGTTVGNPGTTVGNPGTTVGNPGTGGPGTGLGIDTGIGPGPGIDVGAGLNYDTGGNDSRNRIAHILAGRTPTGFNPNDPAYAGLTSEQIAALQI
jgi:hypothetical protein